MTLHQRVKEKHSRYQGEIELRPIFIALIQKCKYTMSYSISELCSTQFIGVAAKFHPTPFYTSIYHTLYLFVVSHGSGQRSTGTEGNVFFLEISKFYCIRITVEFHFRI